MDGMELGVIDDIDPASVTNPRVPDTDGDGIVDGNEDRNQNGRVDSGELDPRRVDTDGDLLPDGAEDANLNGRFEANLGKQMAHRAIQTKAVCPMVSKY